MITKTEETLVMTTLKKAGLSLCLSAFLMAPTFADNIVSIGGLEVDLDALGLTEEVSTRDLRADPPARLSQWLYTEGVARAIRREYLTFESAGRIAYLDQNLKEGDRVRKGQVLAYQEQSRPASTMASANAQLVSANTQLTAALSQVSDAQAQLVQAQTQLTVAEAGRSEADANLLLAKRTFARYSTLLKQKSASQQEYDEAQAQLAVAEASSRKAVGQVAAAKAGITVANTGIATAKANVNSAKAGVANAKAGLGTAQVTKKESYLIAPIDGLVARINIEQGYYYSPQYLQTQSEQQVFNTAPIILIDPSRFEVSLNLPADQYDSLSIGADAYIDITNVNATLEERLPDETKGPSKALDSYRIRGKIHSISPVLNTDLRNFIVTVRTTTGQQLLRDGESVSLWIERQPKAGQ
ncbi:hypothetical protein EOL70_15005 [Leucothrix sargassi]|nr:hypothetical protein EOL70_15005 [Leucothrix sargassi]